jgi:leucyl/phenylalanyl-tRNA--protein transferase
MLDAYRRGWFPMADPRTGAIGWYDPDPRGVIPIERGDAAGAFRVPASLAQRVRSGRFVVTCDAAFGRVIRACAQPRPEQGQPESWIDGRIVAAYETLHEAGHAHSVEAWRVREDTGELVLVGGLYGVAVGGLFAGESMFSRPSLGGTDASKVCLVHLVAHLRRRGFTLLDTQFVNDHLLQFGCTEIARSEYRRRLARAIEQVCAWGPWEASSADAG